MSVASLLLRYDDERPANAVLGGKAGALSALAAAKLPIPPWFVVAPAAHALGKGAVTPELAAALRQTATALGSGGFFAVRSSAVDEDGADHSFAGQLDSFLFVPIEDIPFKVEAVWKSGFSERILAYRRERGLAGEPQPPAVLVQRMVDAEAAGVAFSADPVSGRRGCAVVSAVPGLGTALVSGEADADTFVVDREGRVLRQEIVDKKVAHRASPGHGEGVASVPVPEPERKKPAITAAVAVEIAVLARRTERFFGRPQDIEWALREGKVWLLQSRPITSIATLADPEGVLALWDNANIAESYSGVTTPLTFSFARAIYEAVYREFARLMGVSPKRIEDNCDLFPRMLGLVRGRIYYNLISWYRLLALLPGFSMNRGFMEQMMGVKEGLPEEVLKTLTPAGGWAKAKDGVSLGFAAAGLVRNHFTLPGQIRRFYARLHEALKVPSPSLESMRPDELAHSFRDLERQLLLKWEAPLVNDFFAMIFYGLLKKTTASWCGDADGTLQNDLLCAEGGMISAEPAKRVREMALLVCKDAAGTELLCSGSQKAIERWLEGTPAFRTKYEAYLETFGDRCLEELKLESVTLHDDPLTLLRSVGAFARRLARSELAETSNEAAIRASAQARTGTALKGRPLRRLVFGWVLRNARARVRDRENLRFERTRLFGRVRRIFIELGKRYHAGGRIDEPRDIFFLSVEEALGFVEGTVASADLRGTVAVRKAEFGSYRLGPAPSDRFSTRGAVHMGNPFVAEHVAAAVTGEVIKGIGCCPGIVRGRARVVRDPRGAVIESGEILVAERTDPGWIMLFPSAAGLLVEYGSLLSHSAIVAREMGIPAVVSVGGVTGWVSTGEWLEIDGAAGTARKLTAQEHP